MKLTQAQLERFEREGYLFFPSLFSPAEIAVLTDELPRVLAQHRPENVREKGSDAPTLRSLTDRRYITTPE